MINIGITGKGGFIGTHLNNFLKLDKEVNLIQYNKSYFDSPVSLQQFVKKCDVIVHLAAKNRHNDPAVIYNTNILLVNCLIKAMEAENVRPHIIFSSSTHELNENNLYGKSKKEGRDLFIKWAEKNKAIFSGLIIPNVFGPFGHPYYNSVIATFSYQLTHSESPEINVDGNLKLIYVDELVATIQKIIKEKISDSKYIVPFTHEARVSEILQTLKNFKETYLEKNIFPSFQNNFELNLFNTFRSFIDHKNYFPIHLNKNTDNRGSFVETVKARTEGQFSFSTTRPGITRGNHFHTRKIERFAVISGKAEIQLRKTGTDEILSFHLDGENPSYVDMPIWFTHNITNTGEEDLLTLFWINEFFDPNDPDTYFEEV